MQATKPSIKLFLKLATSNPSNFGYGPEATMRAPDSRLDFAKCLVIFWIILAFLALVQGSERPIRDDVLLFSRVQRLLCQGWSCQDEALINGWWPCKADWEAWTAPSCQALPEGSSPKDFLDTPMHDFVKSKFKYERVVCIMARRDPFLRGTSLIGFIHMFLLFEGCPKSTSNEFHASYLPSETPKQASRAEACRFFVMQGRRSMWWPWTLLACCCRSCPLQESVETFPGKLDKIDSCVKKEWGSGDQ